MSYVINIYDKHARYPSIFHFLHAQSHNNIAMMNFAYRFLITMAFLGPNIYQITRRGIFQSIRWNGVVAFQSMAPKCSSSTRTQNYASNHHQYQPLALALHKHHLSIAAASSSFTQLFMSSDDENDNAETIPTRTSFNIPILKKETVRLVGDDESWADDSNDVGDDESWADDSNDEDGIPLVDGDNPSASWGLMDAPYKMVLCVNTSLGMGKGMCQCHDTIYCLWYIIVF